MTKHTHVLLEKSKFESLMRAIQVMDVSLVSLVGLLESLGPVPCTPNVRQDSSAPEAEAPPEVPAAAPPPPARKAKKRFPRKR